MQCTLGSCHYICEVASPCIRERGKVVLTVVSFNCSCVSVSRDVRRGFGFQKIEPSKHLTSIQTVFTVRRVCMAQTMWWQDVRLSVRPSHTGRHVCMAQTMCGKMSVCLSIRHTPGDVYAWHRLCCGKMSVCLSIRHTPGDVYAWHRRCCGKMSVCLSIRHTPVLYVNGYTYPRSFFTVR